MTSEPVRRVLGGPTSPLDVTPLPGEIRAAAQPCGRHAVMLRIGSLSVELAGLDEHQRDLVRGAYAGFVAGMGDEPTFNARVRPASVEVLKTERPHYLHLPRAEGRSEDARLFARGDADGFTLWSYFFAGWLDRDATRGRLLLCDCADLDLGQAIENYLRFFIATAAVRMGGFLLHSAGVVRDERAWLFFGPSGAGKSTTASNAGPGCVLLGDDLVLVEPWRGTWRACGVPFRGTFVGPAVATAAAPLAMACRLFQASENRLEQAPRLVQVAELLGEIPFLMEDPDLQRRASEVVEKFVQFVPVRRLHLKRDGSYWSVLDEALKGR